jgi:tetratricopeptide (TPR) repeat protein
MGLFDALRRVFSVAGNGHAGHTTSVEDAPVLITAYDSFGREIQIPRRQWETSVLPGSLAEAHDDPDKLYDTMLAALQDGFVERLVEPSAHLVSIDPNRERSHVLRGIVLLKSGDLEGAERVLSGYVEQSGPSGAVLTNLAKVYEAQGKAAEAEHTLWRAIELDPNQDNGLLWWCARERDKAGDEAAFWQAMRKAASLSGSWRPQLWVARQALEEKDLPQARGYYEHVLAVAVDEPGVLMMISGDLGNHGHVDDVIELVLPVYDPLRHDPWTGMNLLQACLDTNNLAEGESLVHRMFELNRPDFKEQLFHYSAEFDRLRAATPREIATAGEPLDIELVPLDRPVWSYGLHRPAWLFASPVERQEQVVLLPLANMTHNQLRHPTAQREDDLGRLTRSIPLYLCESLYFWTDLDPKVVLPVVRGRGPVVAGSQWPVEQVMALAEGARYAICGAIEQSRDELALSVSLWDCTLGRVTDTLERKCLPDELGTTVLRMEQDLARALAGAARKTPCENYYSRPDAKAISSYLTCLGQTLMLSLAQMHIIPRDALWGERNILEHCLWLALQDEGAQVPKILFTSAVAKCHDLDSQVVSEFTRQALELVRGETDPECPFYRLSPLLLRVFDPEWFHVRKAELLATANGEYRQWLQAIAL